MATSNIILTLAGVFIAGVLADAVDFTSFKSVLKSSEVASQPAAMQTQTTPVPAPSTSAKPEVRSSTYRTSKGAVFHSLVLQDFGQSIQAPDGTIWSPFKGDFKNDGPVQDNIVVESEATKLCAGIGGLLPTRGDFEKLMTYFDLDSRGELTDQGRKDLSNAFPGGDMVGRWFWSSTINPERPNWGYGFTGVQNKRGKISERFRFNPYNSVLCIKR